MRRVFGVPRSEAFARLGSQFWLAGAAWAEPGDEPLKLPDSQLEPVKWKRYRRLGGG